MGVISLFLVVRTFKPLLEDSFVSLWGVARERQRERERERPKERRRKKAEEYRSHSGKEGNMYLNSEYFLFDKYINITIK